MPIKVQNAYRINATTLLKLKQFCGDIKTGYAERCAARYNVETAAETISLVEYLPILKKIDPDEYERKRDDTIKAAGLETTLRNIPKGELSHLPETILKSRSILDIAQMITTRHLGSKLNGGINAEITIFPLTNTSLIIASGDYFKDYMAEMALNPNSVGRKYHDLCDWSYQGKTAKPDDVSDEMWEARCKTWERVMPSNIPSKDGLTMPIYDMDKLGLYLAQNTYFDEIEDILKKSNQDDRLENYARDLAIINYAKDTGMYDKDDGSNFAKLFREFDERCKIPGSRANKILNDAISEIKPYMIDFKDENILEPLFRGQAFNSDIIGKT